MNNEEQATPEETLDVENQEAETEQPNEEQETGTVPEDENVGDGSDEVSNEAQSEEMPGWVKKRLGRQQKKHDRERNQLQVQIEQLQQTITNPQVLQQVLNNANQGAQYPQNTTQAEDNSTEGIVRRVMQETEQQKQYQAQQFQQQQAQVYQEEKNTAFDNELTARYDKYEDLEDIMAGKFTPPMIEAAKFMSNGIQTLDAIARSGDLAHKISQLQPYEMMRAMIAESNKVAKGVRQKTISDAPAPHNDSKGSGGSSTHKSIKTMSQAEVDKMFYPDG